MVVYLADLASTSQGLERVEWPDTPETGKWVVKGKANKAKVTTLLRDVVSASVAAPPLAGREPGSSHDDKPLGTRKR